MTVPALRTGEVDHAITVALQAEAAAVELEKIGVRRTMGIVALDAATHKASADSTMREAVRSMLRRVATAAQVGDFALFDLAMRIMAVGTLDTLLVLNQNGVVTVQPEQPLDFVVTFNAQVRRRPSDVITVGLRGTILRMALPALDLATMVVASAPRDGRDLVAVTRQAHFRGGVLPERIRRPCRLNLGRIFRMGLAGAVTTLAVTALHRGGASGQNRTVKSLRTVPLLRPGGTFHKRLRRRTGVALPSEHALQRLTEGR